MNLDINSRLIFKLNLFGSGQAHYTNKSSKKQLLPKNQKEAILKRLSIVFSFCY